MLVDFIGNNDVLNELEKNLENKDISHAYLFLGNEGVGKFTAAKALAKRILCDDSDSSYCSVMDTFEHPDLTIIRSENSIKKAQIEELISDSFKKPFAGKYKVFIIDGFEDVTVSGQNSLLKTLEEPEEYLKIILLSNNLRKILPTILSRVRIIKFNNVQEEDIVEFLQTKENVGIDNARLFARLSGGSVKKALLYSKDPKYLTLRDESISVLDRLINKTASSPFKEYSFFNDNREMLDEIFNVFLSFLRDVAVLDLDLEEENLVNIDKMNLLKKQNLSAIKATKMSEYIIKAIELLEKNTNFQLTIEQLLINIGGVK